MSTDNWATCPRCAKRDMETADEAIRLAALARDEAYGKVPYEQFIELDRATNKARSARQYIIDNPNRIELQTFREDWEIGIGIFPGELYIDYHGRCDICKLDIKFHHTEPVS